MLTQETKRKIDSARNILVGKVPDPKAQVDQITTALIYKFMDDMDKEAIELGGKARFFTKGFEKYAWTKLLDQKLGGHERLELYGEAVAKMSQNPHIPQLFRDIFKDAFLPYRSPETLTLFLKEINGFTYDHSEDLGNAFEYLLSILGSQGDAGQFRTPRHIIDFIVDVVEPKKGDTILDPACGTAGFLISAYKNILKQQKNKPLTPDEKEKLMNNLVGYDISPDMVKLSKVNMYLHGFAEPKIFEYDTLSSEEKWDEMYDVIIANPPFMTPSGGIRPHKRFSIQANRAEVLFVDYIKEHLRPNGRAGVIVPEGIIFQSTGAYKQLRKMLIDDGLFAVVSLPSGVFNPYSGVKTSILFFDNSFTKQTKEILFVKINNDGFGLGAQRREIEKNDIPEVVNILNKWKNGKKITSELAVYIEKNKILESKDYNLSCDRYKIAINYDNSKWPMVELGEIAEFVRGPFGSSIKRSVCVPKGVNTYKVYEQGNVIKNDFNRGDYYLTQEQSNKLVRFELKAGDIVITCAGTLGKIAVAPLNLEKGIINSVLMRVRPNKEKIITEYFIWLLKSPQIQGGITDKSTGVALKNMFATSELKKFKIPLPSIKIQKEIVKKIEAERNLIKSAQRMIDNHEQKTKEIIAKLWEE